MKWNTIQNAFEKVVQKNINECLLFFSRDPTSPQANLGDSKQNQPIYTMCRK